MVVVVDVVVCCCCVVGVVSGGVVCVRCGVLCDTLKNPRVSVQNVPLFTFKTSPCVHSRRAHVQTHVRVVPVHTGTFGTDTRRAGEVIVGSANQNLTTWCYHLTPEVHQRNPWILYIFLFENKSNTARSRFLQSFALPDKVVQLQLS